jgi:peptidoglycan hydrolase-like protein with peptidoglycan-binding domain
VFSSYNMYRPTGFYGLATVAGVKEFQKRTGITGSDANGEVVGPRTLRELVKFGFIP